MPSVGTMGGTLLLGSKSLKVKHQTFPHDGSTKLKQPAPASLPVTDNHQRLEPRVQLDGADQFSHSTMSSSLQPHGLQNARLPCLSPTPGACSNSYSLSWWCHPTISSSVVPFSSSVTPFSFCLQSSPASASFPISNFSALDGQSTGASAWASVLPINIQDWFPLGLTGLVSLQSKGLSRVFSNTTVQKHQFFRAQLSLCSNSRIHIRLLEKP